MIPSFEHFLYPTLFLLRDGIPKKRDELKELCIDFMGFTKEELQEKINSGKKYKIVDRLQWATYYLLKAGLLCRPTKATDQITSEGIELLKSGIKELNRQFLREHYESFRIFEKKTRDAAQERLKAKQKGRSQRIESKLKSKVDAGEELLFQTNNISEIDSSLKTHNLEKISTELTIHSEFELKIHKIMDEVEDLTNSLIRELVDIVNDFDSESFENLLKELMPSMGYSSVWERFECPVNFSHKITASGLVNIDELGLSRFLFVAHNGITEAVNAIDVQSFMGYLSTCGLSKGIYITTSYFSQEALDVPNYGAVKVILVDGTSLAKLMVKFNIGVITRETFEVKEVNQEYLFTHLSHS